MNQEEPFADHIGYDLSGFLYNRKYPPNLALNGGRHHGYATDNQEAFLYDVAVYLYGIKFTYQGHRYWIPSDGDGWVLINLDSQTKSSPYPDPMQLMENETLNGKRLVDIIDDVSDILMQ